MSVGACIAAQDGATIRLEPTGGVTVMVSVGVVYPMLVDEQMRGAIVQGIGGALYEECFYDDHGQLLNGSMADCLVPVSGEKPDIVVAHVQAPTRSSQLGAKGAGAAGTAGAPAAVMSVINNALRPFGAAVFSPPFTPEKILRALAKLG